MKQEMKGPGAARSRGFAYKNKHPRMWALTFAVLLTLAELRRAAGCMQTVLLAIFKMKVQHLSNQISLSTEAYRTVSYNPVP